MYSQSQQSMPPGVLMCKVATWQCWETSLTFKNISSINKTLSGFTLWKVTRSDITLLFGAKSSKSSAPKIKGKYWSKSAVDNEARMTFRLFRETMPKFACCESSCRKVSKRPNLCSPPNAPRPKGRNTAFFKAAKLKEAAWTSTSVTSCVVRTLSKSKITSCDLSWQNCSGVTDSHWAIEDFAVPSRFRKLIASAANAANAAIAAKQITRVRKRYSSGSSESKLEALDGWRLQKLSMLLRLLRLLSQIVWHLMNWQHVWTVWASRNFALQSCALISLMHVLRAPELSELSCHVPHVPPELTSTLDSEKMTSQHSGSRVTCIDSHRVCRHCDHCVAKIARMP